MPRAVLAKQRAGQDRDAGLFRQPERKLFAGQTGGDNRREAVEAAFRLRTGQTDFIQTLPAVFALFGNGLPPRIDRQCQRGAGSLLHKAGHA